MSLTVDDVCFKQMLVSDRSYLCQDKSSQELAPYPHKTAQAMKKLITAHHETLEDEANFLHSRGTSHERQA